MSWPFELVSYGTLNARQQESYNFHRVAARLAEYGFNSIHLSDDWKGADFLACHRDGAILRIQLKGRLTIARKYLGKDIHIAFRVEDTIYVYPHDEVCRVILASTGVAKTTSWDSTKGDNPVIFDSDGTAPHDDDPGQTYWNSMPRWAVTMLEPYEVPKRLLTSSEAGQSNL